MSRKALLTLVLLVVILSAGAQKISGKVDIEYDLKLKKGLNLVQYQLESVYKTDPSIRAAFPTKIKMTNAGENPEIIWMAKYFF